MRILLINLTRFGDVLQTQGVVHGLKAAGHDVGVICLRNFAPAVDFLDGVSFVAALPGSELLAALDTNWLHALGTLQDWVEQVQADFAPDEVLNLTSTPAARLLASRLAGEKPVRGFSLDDHGFGLNTTAWAAFFEASTRTRACSPFNIVDVFLRTAALPPPAVSKLRPPSSDKAALSLASLHPEPPLWPEACVAFQLGASEARRQWPPAYFAAIGQQLQGLNLTPVLLGSASERPLAEAYFAAGGPGLDLVGHTNLPQLAGVLARTRMLVTNDTGTMHLAAGLGIPILAIFLASAQPWDTGPYLQDTCSLEPALPCHPCAFGSRCSRDVPCTGHITADAVWPLIHARLITQAWDCPPQTATLARVWLSSRDAWGMMDLHALSDHEYEDRTIWIRMQRQVYRHFLDELDASIQAEPSSPVQQHTCTSELVRLAAHLSPAVRADRAALLSQADALLHLLHEQGRLTLMQASSPHGRRFLATCNRLVALFESHDAFHVLGRLWHVMSQTHGERLPDLLAFSTRLRHHLARWNAALTG